MPVAGAPRSAPAERHLVHLRPWPRRVLAWSLSPQFLVLVLLAGVLMRVMQFAYERSVWVDECMLALNLIQRDALHLLQPLDYGQSAPWGFLLASRLAVICFGTSDHALRVVPLISGILALLLFVKIARAWLPREVVPVAVLIMAVSGTMIYYSSEIKGYATEVLVAECMLYYASRLHRQPHLGWGTALGFAAAGAVAVWCAHSAMQILASVGLYLALDALYRRDWSRLTRLILPGVVWLASFTVLWKFVVSSVNKGAREIFYGAWLPIPPRSNYQLHDLLDRIPNLFVESQGPLGLYGAEVLYFVFGAGVFFMARRQPRLLLICLLPLAFTVIASALHLYPFANRLLLFMLPVLVMVLATGLVGFCRSLRPGRPELGVLLLVVVLAGPVASAVWHLRASRTKEEIRPVIAYLGAHYQAGDRIFAYLQSGFALRYYGPRYGLPLEPVIFAKSLRTDWPDYCAEMDQLRGLGRVWVLYSFYSPGKLLEPDYLDTFGKRIPGQACDSLGAHVLLYDFSAAPPAPPRPAAPAGSPARVPRTDAAVP